MPWGITILAVAIIAVLWGAGRTVLRMLYLHRTGAAVWLFLFLLGAVLPEFRINDTVTLKPYVLLAAVVLGLWLLLSARKTERLRGWFAAVGIWAVLTGTQLLIPPVPNGYISDPNVLYGLIGGIAAFAMGFYAASAAGALLLGSAAAEITMGLLYFPAAEIGIYGYEDLLMIALALLLLCSRLFAYRAWKRGEEPMPSRLRLHRKQSAFEIGELSAEEMHERCRGKDYPE